MIRHLLLLSEARGRLLVFGLHRLHLLLPLALASLPALDHLRERAVELLHHLVLPAVSFGRDRQLLLAFQELKQYKAMRDFKQSLMKGDKPSAGALESDARSATEEREDRLTFRQAQSKCVPLQILYYSLVADTAPSRARPSRTCSPSAAC